MRHRILLALLTMAITCAPLPAFAGTISRAIKIGSGTVDWVAGTAILPAEMNFLETNIHNVLNGNVDNANIDAAAAIAYSKLNLSLGILNSDISGSALIDYAKMSQVAAAQDADIVDDFSTDDAEQITTSSPGTSDALTNATNLEEEISQIRHMLHQLTVGIADTSAVAASGATAAFTSWADGPFRSGNRIYNGGFDSIVTLATGDDGDGWTRVLTPTTLAQIALTQSEKQGDGMAINIIDTGDALSGISQTLDGLKASTRYLAVVSAKDLVGTCSITTTGADTNQLDVVSDDTNTWQVLAGTFETDATPADVVIQLLAVTASDSCVFDDVAVYEIGPNPRNAPFMIVSTDTTTSTASIPDAITAVPDISIDMTPPRPGCVIEVDAILSWTNVGTDEPVVGCQIDEEGSDKTRSELGVDGTGDDSDEIKLSHSLHFVNVAPTPGTDYTYTIECEDALNGAGKDATYDCTASTCQLWVKMTCM